MITIIITHLIMINIIAIIITVAVAIILLTNVITYYRYYGYHEECDISQNGMARGSN